MRDVRCGRREARLLWADAQVFGLLAAVRARNIIVRVPCTFWVVLDRKAARKTASPRRIHRVRQHVAGRTFEIIQLVEEAAVSFLRHEVQDFLH